MSKINDIFNNSEESDLSEISDYESEEEYDDDEEEIADDDEEEKENKEEEEEFNNDDDEQDVADDDEEIADDDEEIADDEGDYSDDADGEENEFIDFPKQEKYDVKIFRKSKVIVNNFNLEMIKNKKTVLQLPSLREKSVKFIEQVLEREGITSKDADKIERVMFNHCVRILKKTVKVLTIESKEFREKYSKELYCIMSCVKSHMTINEIKEKFEKDIEYFNRGIFEKEKIQDDKKLRLITHVNEPVSGIHKCKCGCEKVYSYELQTRSGDEGMTVFLQCFNCGRKWKL